MKWKKEKHYKISDSIKIFFNMFQTIYLLFIFMDGSEVGNHNVINPCRFKKCGTLNIFSVKILMVLKIHHQSHQKYQ